MSTIEDHPLPTTKKPVKYTPASLRIMQSCEKAFASNNYLLLYFSNKKTFTQQFNELAFKELLRNKFQFLQLSRIDKAGNWLTTVFHFKKSPYFALIDPSDGKFVKVHYGEMTTPELKVWLQQFLAKGPKFAHPQSIFPDLIHETQVSKKKTSYSYGTKLRVTFVSQKFDEKTIYVNKIAPLQIAFEKYCTEKGIKQDGYYFMFRGVEMPGNMTASQFGLKNGSAINVHPLEDKTSTEPLSIVVVGVSGEANNFNVQKGKKVGAFLKTYCEMMSMNPAQVRFTFNSEPVDEDLTFAEHNIRNDDKICAQVRQYPPQPSEYVLLMQPGEIPGIPGMGIPGIPPQMQAPPPEQYDVPLPNSGMMYMYNQQRAQPAPFNAAFSPAFPMPPKTMHPYQKPHDQNPAPSLWEPFDLSTMP